MTNSPQRRPLTNAVSRLLAERDWTDADLARAAGLDRSRINRLKNRRIHPTVHDGLVIAAAFGVPVEAVFSLVDHGRPRRHG